MKINLSIILLLVMSYFFFSCEKEKKHRLSIKSTDANYKVIPGASVSVFNTKENYLLNRNALYVGTTDANGEFLTEAPEGVYYYRVRKDSLNEIRFGKYTSDDISIEHRENSKYKTKHLIMRLSTTPVKVLVKVFDNGVPVEGAGVQFYFTESDYKNRISPKWAEKFEDYKHTGENGEAFFPFLEPREYWFEIRGNKKTNATTLFKTDGKLEDNPDITNIITVGLQ